jgi:hypothetical protein
VIDDDFSNQLERLENQLQNLPVTSDEEFSASTKGKKSELKKNST